jgi:hypothetical protein
VGSSQWKTKETTTQMQMEGELAATSAADSRTGAQHGRVLSHTSNHKDQQSTQHRTLSIFIQSLSAFHLASISSTSLLSLCFFTLCCFHFVNVIEFSFHSLYVEGEISLLPSS